jgi:hypothetical protein
VACDGPGGRVDGQARGQAGGRPGVGGRAAGGAEGGGVGRAEQGLREGCGGDGYAADGHGGGRRRWGAAAGAQDKQRPYLAKLVASDDVITLVSEHAGQVTGFLIAALTPAPGVYDPGGLTCQIDDFVVTPAGEWPTTGAELLRAGLAEAGRRGAIQAVVVTGHLDQPNREALQACGLEIASEWWVTPQPLPDYRGQISFPR